MTPSWIVIPKNRDGELKPENMIVVQASDAPEAATYGYMNAVVVGPVSVFVSDASGHTTSGPVATLPAEGQPQ